LDPLITIETVPIKIEYVEKEQSSHSSAIAQLNISRNDHAMTIESNPISIPIMDTFEPSSNDSRNLTYTATAQYSSYGNLRMNVQMQGSVDNTYQYQQFGRGIDNIVDYFPSTSGDTASQTNEMHLENMQIDFDMSQFFYSNSTNTNSVDTSFYPPDLELKVVERPKVIVKYVGGPIYVPPSADPNYDPSESAFNYFPESTDPNYDSEMAQMYDSKSKLDLKA